MSTVHFFFLLSQGVGKALRAHSSFGKVSSSSPWRLLCSFTRTLVSTVTTAPRSGIAKQRFISSSLSLLFLLRSWLDELCYARGAHLALRLVRARSAEIANLFANSNHAGLDERRTCGQPCKRSQERAEEKRQSPEAVIASRQGQRFMVCLSSLIRDHLEKKKLITLCLSRF